ncbi:MAG: hypothetical protein K5771_00950, partial [Oscillospiraceae bacterium]|nr:hypothetical protein [Oscillospiraceae bacterium]
LLICLLLVIIMIPQWSAAAYGDSSPVYNSSGNLNGTLSVDPVDESDGFTAVMYNNSNGLPTSDANAIAQTGDGFIWIGSYAGLVRYDGNNFERIDATAGIANVRCLYTDSKDRLWIGTNDSGVYLMAKGNLKKWDRSDGLRSVSIRSIAEDDKGIFYIAGAAGGIAMISSGFELTVLEDQRLEGQSVPQLRRGSDGIVYGFTQDGDLFTLNNGEIVRFLGHNSSRLQDVHSIMPDPEHPGRLYIGTSSESVMCGSFANGFATITERDISPLSSVNSMEYIDGDIWICAGNGIGKLTSGGVKVLKNVPLNNTIEHMMTDFGGNLWFVSSHQGMMKIVPNQFSDLFERFGLSETVVNSTCACGDQLFIGTDSGLIVIEVDKIVESLPLTSAMTASGKDLHSDDLLKLLDGVRIRCIFRDSHGRLWIPAWRRYGVIRYDHGEVIAFGKDEGLFSDAVRTVYECEDGSFLVANTGGLSIVKGNRVKKNYGSEDGIVNGEILTVIEGYNNEYILGSDGDGIYIITPEGTKRLGADEGLRSEIILRIKRSANGEFYWIITGNSIAYMTPDYKITTIRNFPYPNNYDLHENSRGDVWVLSSAGIYVVSVEDMLNDDTIDPVFFGVQSGLPYVATANGNSELTPEGDLYIPSSAGVVKVNIEKPFGHLSHFNIELPYIEADGERYYADLSGKFNLPANARKITIYPYVFNYALIDPQVSYRLQGFETGETTVNRSKLLPVDYTNLKIGTYHFIVTVKDTIGHTEQTELFTIAKGKEMSTGTIGTIIMDSASLLMMLGILIFTALYRRRGRLEDKMFLGMILANIALTVGELLSYTLEFFTLPPVRELMIAGNTVFYIMLSFFPYLLLVWFDYFRDGNKHRVRKMKIIYAIPVLVVIIVMLINLKTGLVFTISRENAFIPGPHRFALIPIVPIWIYLGLTFINALFVDKRMAVLSVMLVAVRLLWDLWYPDISSTSFVFTLFLMCLHLFFMNRPYDEEVTEA